MADQFVQDEIRRMDGDDAGNGDAAHLAATQAERRTVGIGLIIEADEVSMAFGPVPFFAQTEIARPEGDVFGNSFLPKS